MAVWIHCFVGILVGIMLSVWLEILSLSERSALRMQSVSRSVRWQRTVVLVILTSVLFVCLSGAEQVARVLETPEVQPSEWGRACRLYYHLLLLSLLLVATALDFDCFVIPDQITVPGMVLGLLGAFVIGELQICHLWVDWSFAIPQLRGPLIPEWYDQHRHWHALSWSFAGLFMGGAVTWCARELSSRVLGQEAMGFGDVTLMAMIGSFLGWQAILIVFLLAPIAGLTVGVMIKFVSGKTYLPYGPWLSMATVFLLFRWGWLWRLTRVIFSDWVSVAILAGIGGLGFVSLLGLLLLYRKLPVYKITKPTVDSPMV